MMKVNSPPRVSDHSPLEDIVEGFRWVSQTRIIRALLLLIGLVSLVGMPYTVLMPVFADKILHGGARGLGILMGATGVGALFGALTLAAKTGVKGLGRWVAITCAGLGVSLVCFSFSTSFWLSVALLLPAGYSMMLQMACSNTLIQTMVPDQLRGRVMSLYSMMFMGMAPFGAFLAVHWLTASERRLRLHLAASPASSAQSGLGAHCPNFASRRADSSLPKEWLEANLPRD